VLCFLEKAFSSTFMDVISHLMIHLGEELYVCGLVHCRWMYLVERYLKTLKDYVRTYARPEASMAKGTPCLRHFGIQHSTCSIIKVQPVVFGMIDKSYRATNGPG
jgi:hypothetical protein